MISLSLFQVLAAMLLLLVIVLLARYAWGIFFDSSYRPVEWDHACRSGEVSRELLALEKNYPDKVRFFNWWFQIQRLRSAEIKGDFAELGVYKGESARIIHAMAPERKLHLFDTFDGFREEDLEVETGEAATYTSRHFADTSMDAVRRMVGDSERIVFHPGHFPGSVGRSEKNEAGTPCYALVNIDVDLYKPTLSGLEYFYPKLSPGGVILVHDHTHKWPGIKKAVIEFASLIPESPVPVPDMDGTVMIVKNLSSSSE
jgi:O-methyltransferase